MTPAQTKWARRPPPPPRKGRAGRIALAVALLCGGAVALAAWYALQRDPVAIRPVVAETRRPAPAPPADDGGRLVTLFFADATGERLLGEIRSRPRCSEEAACIADTLQALVDGPTLAGTTPLLPRNARLTLAEVRGETAVLDLDRAAVERIPDGVTSELLCLTALADTLAVNFPRLRQIALRVDGAPVATLKGHVDLSSPLLADFRLVGGTERPDAATVPSTDSREQPP